MKEKVMKARFWNAERIYQIFLYTVIILMSLICLYPQIYVISASLMSAAEWQERAGVFLFPHRPTFEAYAAVLRQPALYRAFGVSVARTVVVSLLSVCTCAVTGYALSRKDLFGRKFLSVLLFITMIYGGGLIPSYLVIEATGLLNTFWVYVLPALMGAWSALVFRQTFQGMPSEIEESAMVDGATELQVLVRILIPINMPTVAVMLLFAAVGQWNSWFDAMMYVDSNNVSLIPLQLYLQNAFSARPDPGKPLLNAETQKMAIAVIGIVPILCIYPFFQKYFTKGVYVGAVKG